MDLAKKDKLVSISKAAGILGVSPTTLRNWEKRGLITAVYTPGNHRRFTLSELQRVSSIPDEISLDKAAIASQIQEVRQAAGELAYLHYSDRLKDEEVRQFLIDSVDNPDQLSLRGDIGAVDAVLSIHMKRYSEQSSESANAWRRAQAAFNRLRKGQSSRDTTIVAQSLDELQDIFSSRNRLDHESEIMRWQDHRARLVSTEIARLTKGGEYITADEAMRMAAEKLQTVLMVIKERCTPEVQQAVIAAIRGTEAVS